MWAYTAGNASPAQGNAMATTALTNVEARQLVRTALNLVQSLTIPCPNGDTLTVSRGRAIRWGKSQFAAPSGKEYFGDAGYLAVEHCGRGAAAKVARAIAESPSVVGA